MKKSKKQKILFGLGIFFLLGALVMITEDIMATITFGIISIILLYFSRKSNLNIKEKNKVYQNSSNNYVPYGNSKIDDYFRVEKEYSKVLKEHYNNIEKINMLYTIANNLALPNSKEMQKVIDLCIKDIELAPQILNYCKEMANNYDDDLENHLMNYVSFQRLAIIYEKQKEYEKAINICKLAIDLGFYKDGTPGQMPGRLARLIKKQNQQKKKLEKSE